MKKIKSLVAGFISASALFGFVACSSADFSKMLAKPSLSFDNISFASLDSEGVTLNCNYSIKNPYPIALSLAKVSADITCNDSPFTSLNANQGISIAANAKKANTFNFKVPYDSLLNFAKSYKLNSTLPFTVKGSASVSNKLLSSLNLPFSKTIEIPVFKPSFSLSSPKLVMPTLNDLVASLKNSGMNASTAATTAANIIAGKSVDSSILEKMNLNMKLNFDLNVKNEGGSAWNYLLKSCSIKTGDNSMIDLSAPSKSISSSSGTIPLTATLNTMKFGKFIAQIINKSGTNPTFALDSGVAFPALGSINLPLSYSKEIPLSNFGLTKN